MTMRNRREKYVSAETRKLTRKRGCMGNEIMELVKGAASMNADKRRRTIQPLKREVEMCTVT